MCGCGPRPRQPPAPARPALTDHVHLVGGIDGACAVGHATRVLAAVLWAQVLQAQRPLLLPVLAGLWACQGLVILHPHDVRSRVPTGHALETHRTAHGPCDHPAPHLGGLREAGPCCRVGSRGQRGPQRARPPAPQEDSDMCPVLTPLLAGRVLLAPGGALVPQALPGWAGVLCRGEGNERGPSSPPPSPGWFPGPSWESSRSAGRSHGHTPTSHSPRDSWAERPPSPLPGCR